MESGRDEKIQARLGRVYELSVRGPEKVVESLG
jgi:hypothetical protein